MSCIEVGGEEPKSAVNARRKPLRNPGFSEAVTFGTGCGALERGGGAVPEAAAAAGEFECGGGRALLFGPPDGVTPPLPLPLPLAVAAAFEFEFGFGGAPAPPEADGVGTGCFALELLAVAFAVVCC